MDLLQDIVPLFADWDETLIRSVLEGHMGYALADGDPPKAAQAVVGGFCFLAGRATESFAAKAKGNEIVPQNESWFGAIERAWGDRVIKRLRYAIKKERDVFRRDTLQYYVDSLPEEYELKLFDASICVQSFAEDWSRDFCTCFQDCNDFLKRGFGAAVLHEGRLVSGASSYVVCDGGIEVEIDTHPDYRQRGLATVCGARLILEALSRGLYPSWDAFDLRSVALAEKLGYHVDHPYQVYMLR